MTTRRADVRTCLFAHGALFHVNGAAVRARPWRTRAAHRLAGGGRRG